MTADDLKIKLAGHKNLFYFVKIILGYKLLSDTTHRDLCDYVQNGTRDALILEPRDHFKTTCVSVGFAIWSVINNPNLKILISHKILKKSREILREIKTHFEMNKKLRYYYGDHVGSIWANNEIISKKCTRIAREPTIGIGATNHEIASAHYNIIINDDLAGLRDRYSSAERENTKRYYQSLTYVRDRGNFIREINVGTRWAMDDISSYLIKSRSESMDIRIKTAWIDDAKTIPYFPERFTREELTRIEREDPQMFASQMMNNPMPLESQTFNYDDFKFFDMETINPATGISYIFCDPAIRTGDMNDYTAILVGCKINDNIYIVDGAVIKVKADQVEYMIDAYVGTYQVRKAGVEDNGGQAFFVEQLKKGFAKRESRCEIRGVTHSTDKVLRINSIAWIVRDKVYFRSDWEDKYPLLIHQLCAFPQGDHDDAPDCLEGLISMFEGKIEPRVRLI